MNAHCSKHPTHAPGGGAGTGVQYIGSPSDFHGSAEKIVVGVGNAAKSVVISPRVAATGSEVSNDTRGKYSRPHFRGKCQ